MKTPSEHWTQELIRTIQECRAENSDQRFGQLLYNLISRADMTTRRAGSSEYLKNFHSRLFNITDEEFVKILKENLND